MTNWNTRPSVSTTYNSRIGGAYLKNISGEFILTQLGEKIIILVPGGELNSTLWNTRPNIS